MVLYVVLVLLTFLSCSCVYGWGLVGWGGATTSFALRAPRMLRCHHFCTPRMLRCHHFCTPRMLRCHHFCTPRMLRCHHFCTLRMLSCHHLCTLRMLSCHYLKNVTSMHPVRWKNVPNMAGNQIFRSKLAKFEVFFATPHVHEVQRQRAR